ncbi:Hypothetical protein CINCED_3A014362 [Cinara cedri]|uniref:Uncharacterized protein n=1 Tax=Cinara cedri TaxID=506608 RepID=A0A5E4MEX4_9HEMI|nr:Hypothetical protein CINCED_3A014362 [Cinara cedri]
MATDVKKPECWLSTNFYLNVMKYMVYNLLRISFDIAAYILLQFSTLFQCISEKLKIAGNAINLAGSPVKQRCEDYSSLGYVMGSNKNKEQIEINKFVTNLVKNESCIEAESQPQEETNTKSILETDENLVESISNQEIREEGIQTDIISNSDTKEIEIEIDCQVNPETEEKEIQTDWRSNSGTGEEGIETKNTQNYREFPEKYDNCETRRNMPINEKSWNLINGDVFNLSSEYSIAHCISKDFQSFSSAFNYKFGNIGFLMDQNIEVGNVCEIVHDTQYIFYLVVKKFKSNPVLLDNFEKAFNNLLVQMKAHGLKKLAIQKSGLDFYFTQKVKGLICRIFSRSDIEVYICTMPPKIPLQICPPAARVKSIEKNLWEMEPQTDRIMFINLEQVYYDYWKDEIVENINALYSFKDKLLQDMHIKPRAPGEILSYKIHNELLICILISPIENNPLFYQCLEKTYNKMKSQMTGYRYLAFQKKQNNGWISPICFSQCITLLQLIFNDSKAEIWLCGVQDNLRKYQLKQYQKTVNTAIKNQHIKPYSKSRYINRTPDKTNSTFNNGDNQNDILNNTTTDVTQFAGQATDSLGADTYETESWN